MVGKGRLVGIILILSVGLAASSCRPSLGDRFRDPSERLAGSWRVEGYSSKAPANIVVAALVKDPSLRIVIENAFVDRFSAQGLRASVSALMIDDPQRLLDAAVVVEMLRNGRYDGVLAVSVQDLGDVMAGVTKVTPWGQEGLFTGTKDLQGRRMVRLQATLREAGGLGALWAAASNPYYQAEMEQDVSVFADLCAAAAREQRVLQPSRP